MCVTHNSNYGESSQEKPRPTPIPTNTWSDYVPVLYQVLNKQVPVPVPVPVVQVPVQVPVPNLQVPVLVQVLCINYRHSVTLELHKVKFVVSLIFKKTNS